MGGNMSTVTRSDLILLAVHQQVDMRRFQIDNDQTLQKVVITIHLASGGGHPRSVQWNSDHQTPFPAVEALARFSSNE